MNMNKNQIKAKKDFNEMFTDKTHPNYIGNEYELLSEYINSRTKVKLRHLQCENIFEMTPSDFRAGYRCKFCNGNLKTKNESKKDFEEMFINKEHKTYVGNEYELLSEYINSRTKVTVKHLICGTIYEVKPANFKMGSRCPVCNKKKCHVANYEKGKENFEEMFSNKEHKNYIGDEYKLISNISNYVDAHTYMEIKHLKCGNVYEVTPNNIKLGHRCPVCSIKGTSKKEKELQEFIKNIVLSENNKRFYYDGQRFYELDIYIPSLNIGIEFDGLYWHSELNGKTKNYHIDKTNFFKENYNIDVIHVFENEWTHKKEIVKSLLHSKLKCSNRIYARQTEIRELSSKEAKGFLNKTHLQGYCPSSIRYGLYYENELVACMTFGKSRYNKNFNFELLRFSSKLNTTVVGGFSKFLKHFQKNHKGSILSYANLRYSTGNVYEKNGFEFLHKSEPCYFYFESGCDKLYHRSIFQKHKLKEKLNTFNSELTEWENMQVNGYNRIFDCGNGVYSIG